MEPNAPHELLRIRPVAVRSTHCKFDPIIAVPVVVKFPWTSQQIMPVCPPRRQQVSKNPESRLPAEAQLRS